MKVSRKTVYAIGALIQLAESPVGEPVPCSRLAKVGAMPERFLLQVLRSLVKREILQSTRGVEGGYSLRCPAKKITLLQIIEATDGPLEPEIPSLGIYSKQIQKRLQQAIHRITKNLRNELSQTSLTDLMAAAQKGVPAASSLP